MKKEFSFDKETGVSTCTVYQKGITAKGIAKVHPDDERFATALVGSQIAEFRAIKKFLDKRAASKKRRAARLRAEAEFLLRAAQDDLTESVEISLIMKEYIDAKEEFYDNIRNPKERIKWEQLDESLLSNDFKTSLEKTNVIEGEFTDVEGEN